MFVEWIHAKWINTLHQGSAKHGVQVKFYIPSACVTKFCCYTVLVTDVCISMVPLLLLQQSWLTETETIYSAMPGNFGYLVFYRKSVLTSKLLFPYKYSSIFWLLKDFLGWYGVYKLRWCPCHLHWFMGELV